MWHNYDKLLFLKYGAILGILLFTYYILDSIVIQNVFIISFVWITIEYRAPNPKPSLQELFNSYPSHH